MYLINKYISITQRFLYTDFYIYLSFKQVRINNKFQFIPLFSLICSVNTRSIPLTWQNFCFQFFQIFKMGYFVSHSILVIIYVSLFLYITHETIIYTNISNLQIRYSCIPPYRSLFVDCMSHVESVHHATVD